MRFLLCFLLMWFEAFALSAHIGSPDSYLDAKAGPYQLFITVQPPAVIPGVAQLEVRVESLGVHQIRAAPLGMTGPSAKYAPVPDSLQRSKDDNQYFTGSLWLMTTGSAQIRFIVDGDQGQGIVSLPLPAIAQRTKTMQTSLAVLLFSLMSFLVLGLVAISGAAVREAELDPGEVPPPQRINRSRLVMACVFLLLVGVIWFGNKWWNSEAGDYGKKIYKPLQMKARFTQPNLLSLRISDPGWQIWRKTDDLVPDHNHLMHLYVIRDNSMDLVFHLHPEMKGSQQFELSLPDLPAGRYRLYADVVHEDGFPETMTTGITLPAVTKSAPLVGDDAEAKASPVNQAQATTTSFVLPDGYRMIWENAASLQAKKPQLFRFKLLDPNGRKPQDMGFYMGMLGHAAFVKTDHSVFAHIHPNGSVAMAAFMMTEQSKTSDAGMEGMNHSEPAHLPNEVGFPYGFPTGGHYRIIVQMKHGQTVETGVFDAMVKF